MNVAIRNVRFSPPVEPQHAAAVDDGNAIIVFDVKIKKQMDWGVKPLDHSSVFIQQVARVCTRYKLAMLQDCGISRFHIIKSWAA